MQAGSLRKRMLWLFVGCLAVTAAIAIVTVLTGAFSEFVGRVLASSASVSAASVCAMACAAYQERGARSELGAAGVALAGMTLAVALVAIWQQSPSAALVKWVLAMVCWSVAVAHAELLLLPRLAPRHRWIQRAAVVAIGTLAALLTWVVFDGDPDEALGRWLAVHSILVALLTLVVPVVWRIGRESGDGGSQLVLRRDAAGSWFDARGRRYEVRPLEDGPTDGSRA